MFVRLCAILGLFTVMVVDIFFVWLILWQMDGQEIGRLFKDLLLEVYGIPIFLFLVMNLSVFPFIRCLQVPRGDTIIALWISLKKAELKAKLQRLAAD